MHVGNKTMYINIGFPYDAQVKTNDESVSSELRDVQHIKNVVLMVREATGPL